MKNHREHNHSSSRSFKNTSKRDDEANASEPENQENEIQDNFFRPSNKNELRTPMQLLNLQNIDLNYSVVIKEDRTEEDYHNDFKYMLIRFTFCANGVSLPERKLVAKNGNYSLKKKILKTATTLVCILMITTI